jgi:acetyltransferase
MPMSAYPAELEERTTLAGGAEIFLRPLRREDGPLLQDLLSHMSEEDRRLRFFAPLSRLSEGLTRRLTQIDYERRIALLAFDADSGAILGVVRLAAEPDGSRAEFAVAVRSDWQGRGLGSLLMRRMLALAARLGVAEVFGYVLRDNEHMLRMCRRLGFTARSSAAITDPHPPRPAGAGLGTLSRTAGEGGPA